jgi:hypothetical protein
VCITFHSGIGLGKNIECLCLFAWRPVYSALEETEREVVYIGCLQSLSLQNIFNANTNKITDTNIKEINENCNQISRVMFSKLPTVGLGE